MEFYTQGEASQIVKYCKDELFSKCLKEYNK